MKKFFKLFLIIIGVLAISIGIYILYIYNSVTNTVEEMHYPIKEATKISKKIEEEESITFLILGIDTHQSDKGRSDVMIVATINPKSNSIKMVSIPRDTRTMIVGKGFEDKINHSYAFGGPEMTIATVEEFLDIPIDYFASINMWGFRDMVDAVGGVTVENNMYFTQDQYTFPKGDIHLEGEQALSYVRHRKSDGDSGRNNRQKQVINAIGNEFIQTSSITKIQDILQVLGSNVKTNITIKDIRELLSDYSSTRENIETITLNGTGTMTNNIYYYMVPSEERNRVTNILKEHLEMTEPNN